MLRCPIGSVFCLLLARSHVTSLAADKVEKHRQASRTTRTALKTFAALC